MGGPPPPGAEDGGFAGAACTTRFLACIACALLREAHIAHHAYEMLNVHALAAHEDMQRTKKCHSNLCASHFVLTATCLCCRLYPVCNVQ